jgi:hypothetical protein
MGFLTPMPYLVNWQLLTGNCFLLALDQPGELLLRQRHYGEAELTEHDGALKERIVANLGQRLRARNCLDRLDADGGLYKWLALNFPTKWPKGVPTTPEMKQGIGGTPPTEFHCDRDVLLQALDAFAANRENWPPHPIFAGMTTEEWHRWAWLHTDHHLRQFGR